ncbi:hypothetical protein QNH48_28445 [Neobacillus sp. YX16]|uniref:hypothetical protein n=1 Tax=Neobacillus sp. YX16 TaxID=3047874 RepID=UPI0024C41561|nr:hypothetical protein [Neobacillus sp. YX16]WHZ02804.1 hypothetical protein QNH48_28445 [Neobacillus sp. YX16]
MKMKALLIGVTIILVVFLSQKVTSYTEAVVKSDTSIKITDPENALIAAIAKNSVIVTPGKTSEFLINISNRGSSSIQLEGETVTIDGFTYTYDDTSFRNGENMPFLVKVESNFQSNNTQQSQTVQLPLHFKWETGEATIPVDIEIAIQ